MRGRSPRTREGRLGPTAHKSSGQLAERALFLAETGMGTDNGLGASREMRLFTPSLGCARLNVRLAFCVRLSPPTHWIFQPQSFRICISSQVCVIYHSFIVRNRVDRTCGVQVRRSTCTYEHGNAFIQPESRCSRDGHQGRNATGMGAKVRDSPSGEKCRRAPNLLPARYRHFTLVESAPVGRPKHQPCCRTLADAGK